jgi:hypothetical protein
MDQIELDDKKFEKLAELYILSKMEREEFQSKPIVEKYKMLAELHILSKTEREEFQSIEEKYETQWRVKDSSKYLDHRVSEAN